MLQNECLYIQCTCIINTKQTAFFCLFFYHLNKLLQKKKHHICSDFNLYSWLDSLTLLLCCFTVGAQLSHHLLLWMEWDTEESSVASLPLRSAEVDDGCLSRHRYLKSLNLRSSGWTVSLGYGLRAKQVGMFSGCSIQSLCDTPACVRLSDRPDRAASSGAASTTLCMESSSVRYCWVSGSP